MTYVPRAIAAVVLILALAGCGVGPAPHPNDKVTTTTIVLPTSTPEPAALVVERPAALVSFDCNRMLSAFARELPGLSLEDPQADAQAYYRSTSEVDGVINAGGHVCRATNGQSKLIEDASGLNSTSNIAYEGFVLWILPNAAEAYAAIAADHKLDAGCGKMEPTRFTCWWNMLVGSTWVYADYSSHDLDKGIWDKMRAFLAEAGATPVSGTEVVRPAALAPLPTDCEGVFGDEAASALAGRPLTSESYKTVIWGLEIGDAAQWSGAPSCAWYDDAYSLEVRAIDGGAWLLPELAKNASLEPVTLDSLAEGEKAYVSFDPRFVDSVFVEATSGGNLYELLISGFGGDYHEAAKQAAEALLGHLRG